MEQKIKNYLGVAIIISILVLGYAVLSYVGSYSKSIEPGSFRSFSVSGEGKVVAIPDVAEFNFSVITEGGKNLADLQKENIEKANKAIEFVKSKGVEAKDIKTQNYNITPRFQNAYCPREASICPPPEIVGYTITQTVVVKVRDFSKTGEIISGVVKNGANSVSDLSFKLDEPAKAQDEARAEAIAEAKKKAKAIAKAGGFRIGKLLSIEEGGSPAYYRYEAFGKGGDSAAAPAPIIEPGSQEIIVNVFLRYEIQ